MGKIYQGILGGVSGKVANVIGSSWKGIPVLKGRPLSVANPRTAGQVAQRSKMSNAVAFAGNILSPVIKPLWDRFAVKQSGYNAFIQSNIALFGSAMPSPEEDLIISKGKMTLTPIDSIDASSASDTVTINWVDDSGEGYKLATDQAFVVLVDKTDEKVYAASMSAVRSDASIDVVLPENLGAPKILMAYLAFRRADGTIVSDSSGLGKVVPA